MLASFQISPQGTGFEGISEICTNRRNAPSIMRFEHPAATSN
jgi:hypothetical protein